MFQLEIKLCQKLLEKCDKHKRSEYVLRRLFDYKLNQLVRSFFVEKFWSHLPADIDKCKPDSYKFLVHAVGSLEQACEQMNNILDSSNSHDLRQKFFAALGSHIIAYKPHYLEDHLDATYFMGLKAHLVVQQEDAMQVDGEDEFVDEDGDVCSGCSSSRDACECQAIHSSFSKMNESLRKLGLLEGLVGDTVLKVARVFIERQVSAKGKSSYSCSYLFNMQKWVHNVIKKWISSIYDLKDPDELSKIGAKLDQYLKDAYAEVRVAHMFEIILEYPNSEAAVQDIKMCLDESTSSTFRLNLIETVRQSLIESLLHPGVNTFDILTAYISAIKALRSLDPTGLTLQLVTEPVRRYLKSRSDTVRCIVTALTDEDKNSELNREMITSGSSPSEGEICTAANFESWKPDPIKLSSSDDVMKSSRFSDIVSILVNIYETKDLFVEEYQKLLSQRLLNKYDECNLDTELRNLELLTLRFSDCELHRCEVMLKDVQISKRINKRILSGDIRNHKLEGFRDLDVLIVASPFWPDKFSPMVSISDETPKIEFPPEIETAISTYTKAFEAIQASRTLHWRHHLGSVNMDITIGNRREAQNFTVSPLHAALIYLFKEKRSWRLSEITHRTSLPAAIIKSRLALWQRNGLIQDCGEDRYDLVSE